MMRPMMQHTDWVGSMGTFSLAWGLPIAVLIGSSLVEPPIKTAIWGLALSWMGVACLANARRCGRRHCFLTGPFYLLMALAAVLHGAEIVWLGPLGWLWLGITIGLGSVLLWFVPERLWGKFVTRG